MNNISNIKIRKIEETEMQNAINLIMETFLKYEAPDYTAEGIEEFQKAIYDNEWIKQRQFIGAFEENKMVGVIAIRNSNHIALFFVDGNYHRRGIGRKLYEYATKINKTGYFTVNSSPYAHEVYKHLGFVDIDVKQSVNGLIFYPMKNDKIQQEMEKNIKK